jgi:hypothetical protein
MAVQVQSRPEPENPGGTVLHAIGVGLKRIERFHLLSLWLMGRHAKRRTDIRTEQHGEDVLQVWSDGELVLEVRPDEVDWRRWDGSRYCILQQEVDRRWREFNELYAIEPAEPPESRARIRVKLEDMQSELCHRFGELVTMYDEALGFTSDLPAHEALRDICGRR